MNGTVYAVSHTHHCENIGGFPDTEPAGSTGRANAFTADATGTVDQQPGRLLRLRRLRLARRMINWFPDLAAGTFTGQTRRAGPSSGNSEYLVIGGEFPRVNGVAQQGLVRFAIPPRPPRSRAAGSPPRRAPRPCRRSAGTRSGCSWPTNWDRDDERSPTRSVAPGGRRRGDRHHGVPVVETADPDVHRDPAQPEHDLQLPDPGERSRRQRRPAAAASRSRTGAVVPTAPTPAGPGGRAGQLLAAPGEPRDATVGGDWAGPATSRSAPA